MKLYSLDINGYKNLKGRYPFPNNNGYIALIGLNGSGKSNLLEAISIVFDGLINNDGASIPFDYEIEYSINGQIYTRKKRQAKKDGVICKADELEYPSSVIACYSGEDLRLWHTAFEKYHMGYFNEAVKQQYSSPRFLYVNKYCWKIALISLICSNNAEVKVFLKKALNINSPIDVEIDFVIDDSKKEAFKTHAALNWFVRITQDGLKTVNLNTIATTDIFVAASQVTDNEKPKYIFNFLYLLSQPKKNDRNKIDKLIDDIKVSIICDGKKVDFDNLSEGEKKLILIECITKILADKDSLVLLDEPDAHTHIAMKKDLLKLIAEFEGQTIMTTHSPMFLNKRWDGFNENNIFYMHDGKIESSEPLKHLSELTDNEIDYFEGSFILTSKNILVTEGTYDSLYLNQAISFFEKEDVKYNKLRDITMVYSGGTGNALTFYEQILKTTSDIHDKIVYLFDYDKAGLTGWKAIDAIGDPKVIPIFYQEDYSVALDTEIPSNNIALKDTILVEDLFDSHSYESKVIVVHNMNTHREFRCNTQGKTTDAIKSYIEKSYLSFKKEWFGGFKPVLDKLLDVFDLN